MIAAALLVLTSVCVQQPSFDPSKIDDARARKAWDMLRDDEQEDALARFEAEIDSFDTFQARLVKFARSLEERDLGYLPEDPPTPYFDPQVHAPGQPIPRTRLEFDSAAAKSERTRMFAKWPARKLVSAWRYDWGTREIYRTADLALRERRFANALAGFAPDVDFAEAIVERALDDGAQQKELAAFAHAYTDRTGTVFPGITLYDAWASGAEMEMPDVDVLGIVHSVIDEWRKWTAPVPTGQQDKLYQQVGAIFQDANRHRGLRTAIAWTFVEGTPEMRPPYTTCVLRFHALWEANASTPAEVAKHLPKPDAWGDFLAEWSDRATGDLGAAAQRRQRTLESDAQRTRAFFLSILSELGAFERTRKPDPKPAPPPEPKKAK